MIFQILTALSALICILLTIYAFTKKHAHNTVIFAFLMLLITIFITSNFIEMIAKEKKIQFLFRNVGQVCFFLAISTILIFVTNLLEINVKTKSINTLLIFAFPFILVVLNFRFEQYITAKICLEIDKGGIKTPFTLFIKQLEVVYIFTSIALLLLFHGRIREKNKKQYFSMAIGI